MKITHVKGRIVFLLFILANFLILACIFGTSSSGSTPPRNTNDAGESAGGSGGSEGGAGDPTSQAQTNDNIDLTEADLPDDFPIHPGGYDYTWLPGLMLTYSVDADVRTASDFYTAQMVAAGYSDLTGGYGMAGEGDNDGLPTPTKTPGRAPTATPEGWMARNEQVWTKGNEYISISYSANSDGSTTISIVFASQP